MCAKPRPVRASASEAAAEAEAEAEVSRRTFLSVFPKVYKGRHLGHPAILLEPARRVEMEFDRPVMDFIVDLRSGGLTSLMKLLNFFGTTLFGVMALLAMAVVSFATTRDVRFPIFFVLVLLGAFVLDDIVKQFVSLRRPPGRQLIEASGPGYPSGHAAALTRKASGTGRSRAKTATIPRSHG